MFPGLWEGESSLSVMDLGKGGDVLESYGATLSKTLVMGSQKLLQCEVHQLLLLKESRCASPRAHGAELEGGNGPTSLRLLYQHASTNSRLLLAGWLLLPVAGLFCI